MGQVTAGSWMYLFGLHVESNLILSVLVCIFDGHIISFQRIRSKTWRFSTMLILCWRVAKGLYVEDVSFNRGRLHFLNVSQWYFSRKCLKSCDFSKDENDRRVTVTLLQQRLDNKKKQGRIPTDSKLRDVQGYKLQIKMIITTEIGTDFEMEIKFAIIFADTAQMLDMIVVTSLQANPNDGETLLNSYHKP